MVKAALFDMDGVIADSRSLMDEATCALFAERHGIVVEPAEIAPFIGSGEDAALRGLAASHGLEIDLVADRTRMLEIYREVIHGRLKEIRGASALLKACQEAGLKTALVSSADPEKIRTNLAELSIPETLFSTVLSGSDTRGRKPLPDPYTEAAKRLDVDPGECVVIEDALNGIASAVAAGCPCIAVEGSFSAARLRTAGAFQVVRDLATLDRRLLGLEGARKVAATKKSAGARGSGSGALPTPASTAKDIAVVRKTGGSAASNAGKAKVDTPEGRRAPARKSTARGPADASVAAGKRKAVKGEGEAKLSSPRSSLAAKPLNLPGAARRPR